MDLLIPSEWFPLDAEQLAKYAKAFPDPKERERRLLSHGEKRAKFGLDSLMPAVVKRMPRNAYWSLDGTAMVMDISKFAGMTSLDEFTRSVMEMHECMRRTLPTFHTDTQFVVELGGITLGAHFRPSVMNQIHTLVTVADTEYPGFASRVILRNVSPAFAKMWPLVQVFLSQEAFEKVSIVS